MGVDLMVGVSCWEEDLGVWGVVWYCGKWDFYFEALGAGTKSEVRWM